MLKVVLLLLLLGFVWSRCDFTVSKSVIYRPGELTFEFSQYRKSITVCFQLEMKDSQLDYLLRLDYLPFQCLIAKNDIKMEWSQQKQKYMAEVEIGRLCKKRILHQDEQQPYRLIYEFRQGYANGGILVYKQLLHSYLPTLVAIFFISIVAQRLIFGSVLKGKGKYN